MSDIVERLRIWDDPGETICREAAAEIEWLQRELNAAITAKGSCELEIEQLRAVLEEYACPGLKDCSQPKLDDGSCLAEATGGLCGDAAYRALGETK